MAASNYIHTRKPRGENWRIEEELVLMKAYGKHRDVIEGKFSSGVSLQYKWRAWEQVAAFVCSHQGPQRTTEECKAKVKNIKAKAKKKRDEALQNGRSLPITLSQAELLFLEIDKKEPQTERKSGGAWSSDDVTEGNLNDMNTARLTSILEPREEDGVHPMRGIKREYEEEEEEEEMNEEEARDSMDIVSLQRQVLLLKKEKLEEEREHRQIKFKLEVEKLKLEIDILKAKPLS
ncbi:hypothetical protein CAPTEDRAFT_220946 [Capitella teleta]|uniref:Myb/SANT-like DNA-binding domain-containing protein n=1 Tax=Capitella teleta TaxID=283909 RepID=R7U558_CAPTE|nr:hypothetical protein CAPTEDRAFT_220946 [Capitella teleta]|eukprot:ELT98801.1 hypothetical protein CAPTEDRAFT_220946 [Capitella teleta]